MPQAPETLCLIHFWGWKNSLFQLFALWGIKNWPPSMKVKKFESFQTQSSFKDCKWSRLNGPGTETLLSHPILNLDESLLSIIGPQELASQYESEKVGNLPAQNVLDEMHMVQFECPRH